MIAAAALALGCTGVTINEDEAAGISCADAGATSLTPSNGRVSSGDNCFGIEGPLWSSGDGFSTVTPRFNGQPACIQGSVAQVVAKDYDTYWGVVAGLDLSHASNGAARGYDATAHGLSGFSVALSGSAVPPAARVRIQVQDTQDRIYCQKNVATQGSFDLSSLRENCWLPSPGGAPPGTGLKSVALFITAVDAAALPFDLCFALSGLQAGD